MQYLRKISCDWIKALDLFSIKVPWFVENNRYGTCCSSVVTLFVLALFIVLVISNLILFFTFDNYTNKTTSDSLGLLQPLTLNRTSFDIAVSFDDNTLQLKVFKVVFALFWLDGQKYDYVRYDAVPCNLTSWKERFGSKVSDQLELKKDLVCMPPDLNLTLYGNTQQAIAQQLFMSVVYCEEGCIGYDQSLKYNLFSYTAHIARPYYDMQTKEVVSYFLDSSYTVRFNPNKFNPSSFQIEFSSLRVNDTYANVWPNFLPFHKETVSYYFDFDKVTPTQFPIYQSYAILQIHLVRSSRQVYVSRQLYKVADLLAYIGGMFNLVFVLGLFLGRGYNNQSLMLSLKRSARFDRDEPEEKPIADQYGLTQHLAVSFGNPCIDIDNGLDSKLKRIKFLGEFVKSRLSVDNLLLRLRRLEQGFKIQGYHGRQLERAVDLADQCLNDGRVGELNQGTFNNLEGKNLAKVSQDPGNSSNE